MLVGLLATAAFAEAPAPAPPATAPNRAAEGKAVPAPAAKASAEPTAPAAGSPGTADAPPPAAAAVNPDGTPRHDPASVLPAPLPALPPVAEVPAAGATTPPAAEPALTASPRVDVPGTSKDELPPEDLDFGWMLLRTLVVLGIVIMLVYLSLNVGLRKLMGVRAPVAGASVVQVLERVPLDSKHGLFVVRAAGEYLLIGGGDGNLQLIAKLSSEEVERLRSEAKGPSLTLSPLVQRLLGRREPTPPATKGSN